jgi:hypothetical protein
MEGLLRNDTNIHAGIRTTLSGPSDYENDGYCGFEIVEAREIDTIGTDGIIEKIRKRVGTENPVYLSIDIDTLDPACEVSVFYLLDPFTANLLILMNSCPGYWYPRNWRLVHTRTSDYYSWS